eukprot:TRINITY_DN5945_c0_g1_i3.p1 TRINITY_DN5945_c0_g1~~TRINITY_DN5945_c0_g1_i3.p1  ORF type:complete len:118 (+),score=43.40 TRINITY_DN5945_c0_g1_i3:332-685(+)
MTEVQTITINGQKAVVLPIEQYEALMSRAEDFSDIRDAAAVGARIAAGEETFPADLVKRIVSGESRIKVYREYRGLSQRDLAEAAGVGVPAISKIEKEIGRAVQQECRDRSRMPSSA